MSRILKICFLLAVSTFCRAQSPTIDSLIQALQKENNDTIRVQLLNQLSYEYLLSRPDTALVLAQQGLFLAKKTGYVKGEATNLNSIANAFQLSGNYPKALQLHLEALKKAEIIHDKELAAKISINIGNDYYLQGNYRQMVSIIKKTLFLFERLREQHIILVCLLNLGDGYEKLNMLDSALAYTNQAFDLAIQLKDVDITGSALTNLGNIYLKTGQNTIALNKYRLGLPYLITAGADESVCESYLGMATFFQKARNPDSCLYYAKLSLATAQKGGFINWVLKASNFLTSYYTAAHNVDSAFVYQSATIVAKDSLYSQEKQREFQSLSYDEAVRQRQIAEAKEEAQTQLKFNMLLGGLCTLVAVAFLLYRNNRQKQNANVLLTQQKIKVESTLQELKATQAQLVQSAKMASLGELTAGIAHEIQNPLNFVNNFSETNTELIQELRQELKGGHIQQANDIAADIEDNEQKINHHGKRADAIVKNMLEHSRISKGEKQLTDINVLVEEYLRLAYHGIRAKDKSFNATINIHLDASICKINVVPQEIGRVLLNLFNNAFYAMGEKKKYVGEGYEPIVIVSTKKEFDDALISVKDNGKGIPRNIVDKIFQPFFTTKPTGQGTGLGLSLSYDIIKAHGGELKVISTEGEYAEFTIELPVM